MLSRRIAGTIPENRMKRAPENILLLLPALDSHPVRCRIKTQLKCSPSDMSFSSSCFPRSQCLVSADVQRLIAIILSSVPKTNKSSSERRTEKQAAFKNSQSFFFITKKKKKREDVLVSDFPCSFFPFGLFSVAKL